MSMRPTDGINALTEKEKQTLRLIVRGHDAKSIARNLNLSIHTINERLRDVRRKLAVSSSREAARLLFDAEEGLPNPLGDANIGEAQSGPEMRKGTDAGRIHRLTRITVGGIVMSLLLGLIALASLPQQEARSTAGETTTVETRDAAIIDTARRFLELGDEGNWAQAYRMTGAAFHKANTLEAWSKVAEKVRPPLGSVRSRVVMSEQFLPAPPSGYEVVKFRTDFSNKDNVVETVTLNREDGGWKVAGVTVG